MLFEPDANVTKSFTSQLGRTDLSFRGQAFVYAVAPKFNNANFGVQALHHIDPNTRLLMPTTLHRIFLLGDKESRQTDLIEEERVTSPIGSVGAKFVHGCGSSAAHAIRRPVIQRSIC